MRCIVILASLGACSTAPQKRDSGWYDCPGHASIDAPREGQHYATNLLVEVEIDSTDEFFSADTNLVDDTGVMYMPMSSQPGKTTPQGTLLLESMYQLAASRRYTLTALPQTDQIECGDVVTFFTD